MTVQTTSNLASSIRTQYIEKYIEAAKFQRLYDAYSKAIGKDLGLVMSSAINGSSVQVNFASDMQPGTTAISQTADINPQILKDATASITPTSRGEALQWSENLDIQVYTNYGEHRHMVLGKNAAESIDILAAAAALKGNNVKRATARASLDAGTATHNLTLANFIEANTILQTLKCPMFVDYDKAIGKMSYFCTLHPEVFFDILTSGAVESVGIYQDKEIVLNWELGRVGNFKLLVSPWAKVFGAAGADNASNVDTTLSSSCTALATQIVVASASNITSGDYLTIGTEETGSTFQPLNERVRVSDAYVSGTTIDIIGEGANGGTRFAHDSAVAVRNADTVFPVLFGGPESIAKLYAEEVGPYGKVVGPKVDGLVDQFQSLGWKYYGNYGRWVESWLLRGEYSSSLEA